MRRLQLLVAVFISVFLFVGCGGSSSSDTPSTTPPGSSEPGTSIPFTEEIIAGLTMYLPDEEEGVWYRVVFNADHTVVYLSEADRGEGTWNIESKKLICTWDDGEIETFTLIEKNETEWKVHGDSNEGDSYDDIWNLQQKFTYDMIEGKTFMIADDDETCTITFSSKTEARVDCGEGIESISYTIDDNGAINADDEGTPDLHYLIRLEENGDMFAWNEDQTETWVLK
jgi:hypothetical protein